MINRTLLLLLVFILANEHIGAQVADWSTTVASIIYNNCSSCHHEGGIAPFPLTNYQEAVSYATDIKTNVVDKAMPPWPADPAYRHFTHEAILDSAEIAAISDWVDNNMPLGDTTLAPPSPVYSQTGSVLDTIDFTIEIPPYTLQYNTDEDRYFAFHSGFTDTVYVSKIEVLPGLDWIVHHADIHYDLSGTSFYNDSITPLPGFSGGMVSNYYMNAWQPGGNVAEYPQDWGIMVPPGADFVLEIHYGPGGQGWTDSTKMNLRFITNPVNVRPIHVGWLLNNPIPSQGPLVIPPNVITTFNQMSAPMPTARSLISICPHMHKLGYSYKVWYKDLAGDSVPLINIPHWDFHWQKYYMFQQVQKIPAGARLYSVASFDNTVNNPNNPNNPPITVYYGPTTEDEMLMTYFIYANYQPGDENIILDSTLIMSSLQENGFTETETFNVYPNPSQEYFYAEAVLKESTSAELLLTDMFGQLLRKIPLKGNRFHERVDMSPFFSGIYFARLKTANHSYTKKILLMTK